ncbi:AraC family transcriptional regulator [Halobacillus sp. ACCC02827]|uniref:AraC family transcriptional regulator n=1 Tax=Halobacillus sp. ACCC02827 TaxID=3052090 RepID=UPI002570AEB6|nr:AraC family transcriptional regulator [Halobacillus sp. ACCC02827]WJE17210.1 AraC family transcriptional regulator [Halobacillus sp. ACCC02827]
MEYPYEQVMMERETQIFMLMPSVEYISMHWHDRLELILVLDGNVRLTVEKDVYDLQALDLVVVNADEIHGVEARGHNRLIIMQIPVKFLESVDPDAAKECFMRFLSAEGDVTSADKIRKRMIEMLILADKNKPFDHIKIHSLCLDILYLLLKGFRTSSNRVCFRKKKNDRSRLNRMIQYIQDHFSYPITLADLAKQEGLSRSYVSRYFRKHMGISFMSYLKGVRLEHALRMLIGSDWSITDIALQSGFSNLTTFHNLFKTTFHITPHQYRKQARSHQPPKVQQSGSRMYHYEEQVDINVLEKVYAQLANDKD